MSADLFAFTTTTNFTAICNECRTVKTFGNAHERDLWLRNHPHQEDPA